MRLIDADAIIQIIDEWREQLVDAYGINDEYVKCLGDALDIIEKVPTIEERKKGKWIKRDVSLYRCSECGRFSPSQENYCPSCGSYNGEENENEEIK